MNATPDDARAAVGISVTLSGQLTTAALGMIAVTGAFATFLIDKRVIGIPFWLFFITSLLSFVCSIICGGKGITFARNAGFYGGWNLGSGKGLFNLQAIFLLVGLVLFILLILVSRKPKDDDTQKSVLALESANQNLLVKLDSLVDAIKALRSSPAMPSTVTSSTSPAPTSPPISTSLSTPISANRIILGEHTLFDFNKSEILAGAEPVLNRITKLIADHPDVDVLIRGYTDNKGSTAYNIKLSERRADAIKTWFVNRGIPSDKLWVHGLGAATPVSPNMNPDGSDNPQGREKNRRVEIFIKD